MRRLSDLIYISLLLALTPIILYRVLRHGRYKRGLREKLLGLLPRPEKGPDDIRPLVWFHAVSVGEIIQLQKVVQQFREDTQDGCEILITTSTDSGFDLASSRFPDCTVTWFPLDFSWAVSSALRRVNPDLVVLMELELWPGFLSACSARKVPVAIVNARLSERSCGRYQLIRRWMSPVLSRLALVAAQSPAAAARLRSLGVRDEVLHVTGSIKFDGVQSDRSNSATTRLRTLLAIPEGAPVLVCGSTQAPEEQLGLNVWQQLQQQVPDLHLILVPRHQERFEQVARLVQDSGLTLLRRSAADTHTKGSGPRTVRLLDTIGELGACWGLADIAFVGGSFGSRGGQNMIEPAAYGAAVMFGPRTRNFRDVVRILQDADACRELADEADFSTAMQELLQDPARRNQLGHNAAAVVSSQQGAVNRTSAMLLALLPMNSQRPRAAA